jgi:hypothetical protein
MVRTLLSTGRTVAPGALVVAAFLALGVAATLNVGCGEADGSDPGELAAMLRSGDENVRLHAAIRLEGLGPAAAPAIPSLVAVLEHPEVNGSVADHAVRALGRIGPKAHEAVPALVRFMERARSSYGCKWAADALREIASHAELSVPAIVRALESGRIDIDRAARALAVFGENGAPAVPALVRALEAPGAWRDDENASVLYALGKIGPSAKGATSVLKQILLDESADMELRIRAAEVLGAIGVSAVDAVPALESVLERGGPDIESPIRRAARHSLEEIRNPK